MDYPVDEISLIPFVVQICVVVGHGWITSWIK